MKRRDKPRTISQLVTWLEAQLGNLTIREDGSGSPTIDDSARRQAVLNLTGSLHQTVSHLRECLLTLAIPSDQSRTVEQIARAIVVAGGNGGFDVAIRSEITRFHEAADEVLRIEETKGIGVMARRDLIAGWERAKGHHQHNIQLLGVDVDNPRLGGAFIEGEHFLDRTVAPDDPQNSNRIARVITPRFSWTNNIGQSGYEPARVWAFSGPLNAESLAGASVASVNVEEPDNEAL